MSVEDTEPDLQAEKPTPASIDKEESNNNENENNNKETAPADADASADDTPVADPSDDEKNTQSMTLDVAYKSLESIRQVNIQIEFERNVDEKECIPCLRQERDTPQIMTTGRFGRFRQIVSEKTASKALPCLTCGLPVCKSHRSSDFGKQNITVCNTCAHLFSTDYMMKNIVLAKDDSSDVQKRKMNEMLEVS